MLFENITVIDENLEVQNNMFVGVKGDVIDYIGKEKPAGGKADSNGGAGGESYGRVYDGRGKCLMSGFVNGHAHSPMTLLRGYAENMNLQEWLFDYIFPYEAHLDSNAVYYATLLSIAESLKNGIVSTSDMYYFCEDMVRAYEDAGAKGNISRSVSLMDDEPVLSTAPGKETKQLFLDYDGCCDGRIRIDMSLHSEYTNCDRTVREMAELTKELGTGMHVHVAETKKEFDECIERHGLTPTAYLAEMGLFDSRTIGAHCVWLTEEDMDILKDKGVFVASNPVSNLKLASGVCNVPALLEKDIPISIGTDSVSSNNSLDYIEEMKIFAIAPKMYYNNSSAITPEDVLRAATVTGARAQGRKDTGILKEGMKADLIVMDIMGANMHPVHQLKNNIVYSASSGDILLTMTDGKVQYENGEYMTIDIEKTIFETEKANEKILSKI